MRLFSLDAAQRKRLGSILNTSILLIITILFFLPIVWACLMSFKTRVDALAMPPKWVFKPTMANYKAVWGDGRFLKYTKNSLIIAAASTGLGLVLGVPAAYSLARHRFKGREPCSWVFYLRG